MHVEPTLTDEEVVFLNAKRVLDKIIELGVERPSVQMFADGSGCIHLGPKEKLKGISPEAVFDVIKSQRVSPFSTEDDIQIDFCESLKGELRS